MKKFIYIIAGLLIFMIYSCKKWESPLKYSDPEIKTSSTYPISGEWWVTLKDDKGKVLVDYSSFLTYNTSSDKGDSVWIDDQGKLWNFKIKAACNVAAKSFSADSVVNTALNSDGSPYNIKVDIKEGKVIVKGGLTKGGNVSDSIYMKIGFTDGPSGTIYVISGVRRTGFKQDDY